MTSGCLTIVLILLAIYVVAEFWYIVIPLFAAYKIYEYSYFHGEAFLKIKKRIQSYIDDANNLNRHIEELKNTPIVGNKLSVGNVSYKDTSEWNVKRPALKKQQYAPNVHNCSRTVCDGARKDPFRYISKYFGIDATEESLTLIETALNNFEAAEEGKVALKAEREKILSSINSKVPFLIKCFSKKKLERELGFEEVDLSTDYFPKYIFQYISSGGKVSTECTIVLDIENLNKFVVYLSEKIKYRKSAAFQRALMTSRLRKAIKERDNYTCVKCGVSTKKEPTLLLEIDHIIPVARGGLTTEDNLQTLCWRCNRTKGAKM